ncbi:hypothetical protein ABL78_7852 [Leptomonas seymouri]|uniref:Uncharacterized protein n=1 Tax=Leptomonas seymouri TaxID=5684 RepID=A0A0N1P9U0_LEPSE|nr:hypothetical protein ABL78_7852 [Leptomonas seymouri]|eukprot:KPI83120.1 hypothetical protein ABL78_7852 [Leptomonas seymouri]
MSIKGVLQGLLLAACAGAGGGALSIWAKISKIEPLAVHEAHELTNASGLTLLTSLDHPKHRRVYAYRLEARMPAGHATEQLSSRHSPRRRGESSSDKIKEDSQIDREPPSLGSLYALHAMEAAFPFRCGWMWQTFRNTYRISNTFYVWYRTRPSWMSSVSASFAAAPDVKERVRLLYEAAEEVEMLSDARYEAVLEFGGSHGAVIRGGQRTVTVTCEPQKQGESEVMITTEMTNVAPIYRVQFLPPDASGKEKQEQPHLRSASLYVLYLSAPYRSDHPTGMGDRLRMWKDSWYSRWFAAHVVKSLSKM